MDKAYGEGFYVQGLRYVVTKIDGRSLYGRGTGDKVCFAISFLPYLSESHLQIFQAWVY